jgi:hypothetical protein
MRACMGRPRGICVHASRHAPASEPPARTVHAGAFRFIFRDSSCPAQLALHFLSQAL